MRSSFFFFFFAILKNYKMEGFSHKQAKRGGEGDNYVVICISNNEQ